LAAGDYIGQSIFFEKLSSEHSTLSENAQLFGAKEKQVNVVTLDSELRKRSWEYVDFIKIDTEGFDLKVLR
jgi:FkbM family methyltransferase